MFKHMHHYMIKPYLLLLIGVIGMASCNSSQSSNEETDHDADVGLASMDTGAYLSIVDTVPIVIEIPKTTEPKISEPKATESKPKNTPKKVIATVPVPVSSPTPTVEPEKPVVVQGLVQTAYFLKAASGTINGTSNLHDWESFITRIDFKGTFQSRGEDIVGVSDVELRIPVESIESSKGSLMDKKTYSAFESDKNPNITYQLASAVVSIDENQNVRIEAGGTLSMAGVSQPISVTITGKKLPSGELHLVVNKKLRMTQFKMDPPSAMLGTITVGDEVSLLIDMTLAQTLN